MVFKVFNVENANLSHQTVMILFCRKSVSPCDFCDVCSYTASN
uniref:Uncharacterized protein n=1 Tax=Rhizophora mucronata TaxID=61149 RepID=A0A2P2LYU1_RHIMU